MRILALLLSMSAGSMAELSWQQNTITNQVHPTQVFTEAQFRFSNTGPEPAFISDVVVTCGCLSAKPSKKSIAPGEEGVVTLGLNLRNRQGKLRKMALVRTRDGQEQILTICVNIPPAYVIEPRLIRWDKADDEPTKTVHLLNPNETPIRLLSISSSHEALPAKLETIREGFEYEVVVTRSPDAQQARSVIRIATEPPPGYDESITLKIYAIAP